MGLDKKVTGIQEVEHKIERALQGMDENICKNMFEDTSCDSVNAFDIFKVGKRCGLVKDGNYAMGSRPSQQCASGETRPDTQKLDNSWASNHQFGGRRLSVEDSNHGRRLRMVCGLQSNGKCVSGRHPHIYCVSGESKRTNGIHCWSGWKCVKCRKGDTCHPETESKVCTNVWPRLPRKRARWRQVGLAPACNNPKVCENPETAVKCCAYCSGFVVHTTKKKTKNKSGEEA